MIDVIFSRPVRPRAGKIRGVKGGFYFEPPDIGKYKVGQVLDVRNKGFGQAYRVKLTKVNDEIGVVDFIIQRQLKESRLTVNVSREFKEAVRKELQRQRSKTRSSRAKEAANFQILQQKSREIESLGMKIGRLVLDIESEVAGGVWGPQARKIRKEIHGGLDQIGRGLKLLDNLIRHVRTQGR